MTSAPPPRFRLLTAAEIDELPDPEYLIEGVLPRSSFGVLYGHPGGGKSFVALSMATAVATGQTWFGRPVRRAKVLYIAGEGGLGWKKRSAAYRMEHTWDDKYFRTILGAPQLTTAADVAALRADMQAENFSPDLIVLDTLARLAVGMEESNAKDMGEFVHSIDAFRGSFDAAVLLIHHKPKAGNSMRGSSSLEGAVDLAIECDTEDDFKDGLTLKCRKMKDDEPFNDIFLKPRVVEVRPGMRSVILEQGDPASVAAASSERAMGLARLMMERFPNGAPRGVIMTAFVDSGIGSKSTFKRAQDDLEGLGLLSCEQRGRNKIYTLDRVRLEDQLKGTQELSALFGRENAADRTGVSFRLVSG